MALLANLNSLFESVLHLVLLLSKNIYRRLAGGSCLRDDRQTTCSSRRVRRYRSTIYKTPVYFIFIAPVQSAIDTSTKLKATSLMLSWR